MSVTVLHDSQGVKMQVVVVQIAIDGCSKELSDIPETSSTDACGSCAGAQLGGGASCGARPAEHQSAHSFVTNHIQEAQATRQGAGVNAVPRHSVTDATQTFLAPSTKLNGVDELCYARTCVQATCCCARDTRCYTHKWLAISLLKFTQSTIRRDI